MPQEFSIGRPIGRKEKEKRNKKLANRHRDNYGKFPVHTLAQNMEKQWLLIYPHDWVMGYYIHQLGVGTTIVERMTSLRDLLSKYRKKIALTQNLFIPPGTEINFLIKSIKHVVKNQRVVNAFRCLARRWLRNRFKNGNEEDLLTGEIPKNPIRLVVWSERTIYTFEATTIMRDMVGRLFTQEYLFPKYLIPRNPYTNCTMTYNQFLSVMYQLRRLGYSHWALEGLLLTQYRTDAFIQKFGGTIKKEVILREFKKPGADVLDLTLTFIEDQYWEHNKMFSKMVYRWALAHQPKNYYMRKWIELCRDYYMITFSDGNGKSYTEEKRRIANVSKKLCESNAFIVSLYKKEHPDALEAHFYIYSSIAIITEIPPVIDDNVNLQGFWPDDALDGGEVPAPNVDGT